jgi:PAS domain S-box-containing protein
MKDKNNKVSKRNPVNLSKRVKSPKKATLELQMESEEKYRTILENIEDGYYEVDLAGNFTFFNKALCRLSGCSNEELLGMNNRQFIDNTTAKEVFQMFNKVYHTGEPSKGFDWQMTRKDGTKRYVEASASLLKDSSGKPIGFRGIIRDITKRKKVEEQYRLLADNITEHVWLRDISSLKIIYISPSVEKMYGYTLDEIKNLPLKKLLTEESFQQMIDTFITEMPKALKTLPPAVHKYSFETHARHRDGHLLWMDNTISFMRDENGNLTLLLGETWDITERKEMEEKLRNEEHLFRTLAEQSSDIIVLVSRKGIINYENPAIEKALGYKVEERIGSNLFDLIHPDDLKLLTGKSLVLAKDKNASTLHAELRLRHRDGSWRTFEVTANNIVHDKLIEGGLVNLRDITERKRAQEALEKSEAQYRLLADHMKDQVWMMDLNLKTSYVSPSVEKLLGYTFEELKKLSLKKLLTAESFRKAMDFFSKEMSAALASASDYVLDRSLELQFCCKNGRTIWGESMFSFIRDEHGKPVSILGEGRNITERKQMEDALKKGEERYRSVFENAGLPMVIMEDSLLIFMVNDRFVEMSGYSKDEIEGKMKFTDFIASGNRYALMQCFSRRKEDKPVEYECRIAHRNGELFDVLIRLGHIPGADQFIASFTDITSRKQAEVALLESQEHLQKENIRLRSSIRERYRFCDIIGKSEVMQDVYEFILQAAATQANVIIYGESGTGKELVAKAIHETSDRSKKSFVTVHCGAIPETLMESEFFGYKKGSFTGANMDRPGYLDEADGGTLFLDEVGEIGLNMQVKLLRAIAGGGYTPVGSSTKKNTDVRIVAATNRNLRDLVKRGIMREDFFYRIHILPIYLPPLRDRKDDLPLLVDHFLQIQDKKQPPLPGNIAEALINYDWPGNIRELQNVLHRYLTLKRLDFAGTPATRPVKPEVISSKNGNSLHTGLVPVGQTQPAQYHNEMNAEDSMMTLEAIEKDHIMRILSEHNWHRGRTASALGINRKTLFLKMQKFGITHA